MVEVDIFWAYGIGAGFAAAATHQIARSKDRPDGSPDSGWKRLVSSPYAFVSVLYCALLFAPSGAYLLWAFPDWETMQVAQHHIRLRPQPRQPHTPHQVPLVRPPQVHACGHEHDRPTGRQLDDDPARRTEEQGPVQVQHDIKEVSLFDGAQVLAPIRIDVPDLKLPGEHCKSGRTPRVGEHVY